MLRSVLLTAACVLSPCAAISRLGVGSGGLHAALPPRRLPPPLLSAQRVDVSLGTGSASTASGERGERGERGKRRERGERDEAREAGEARDDDIFCNRALSMQKIQAVGFDMDYTLAEYIPETFDLLAYEGAKEKLVEMGYPPAIRAFTYDGHSYQRGLVIDKSRGNLIKLDRHKYVKVAYHGDRLLSSKERKQLYANSFETQPTFTPPQFATVDTEFQLVDSSLYCQANRRNMSSASFSLKSPPLFFKKSSFFKEKVSSPIF